MYGEVLAKHYQRPKVLSANSHLVFASHESDNQTKATLPGIMKAKAVQSNIVNTCSFNISKSQEALTIKWANQARKEQKSGIAIQET